MKMIVSDLDGTLLNRFHTLDHKILKSIDAALEAGIIFVFATGRALQGESIGLDYGNRPIYLISNNGATIRDPQGKLLYLKSIDKQFVASLLDHFPDLPMDFIGFEQSYVNASKEDYLEGYKIQGFIRKMVARITHSKTFNSFTNYKQYNKTKEDILNLDVLKVNARVGNEEVVERFKEHLKRFPNVINLPFSQSIFEITDIEVNKAVAVKFLADHLGIDYDDVVVFGDGGNDVPMLKAFKNSYAPSNAIQEAKKSAREVLGHYWRHSVSKKISELVQKKTS